jgi:hypothetical protein
MAIGSRRRSAWSRIGGALLAVAVVAGLASAPPAGAAPGDTPIAGTVIDVADRPVAGATVSIVERTDVGGRGATLTSVQTDVLGAFTTSGDSSQLAYGAFIDVTPPEGYNLAVATSFEVAAPGDLATLSLELTSPNFVARLVTADDTPVSGASINAFSGSQYLGFAATAADGWFALSLPDPVVAENSVFVSIDSSAATAGGAPVRLSSYETTVSPLPAAGTTTEIVLPNPNLTVRVVLDDADRTPVSGVSLDLRQNEATPDFVMVNGTTGADGLAYFQVDDTVSAWRVQARPTSSSEPAIAREYAASVVPEIAADGSGTIEVALKEPTVVVSVVDEEGVPIPEAYTYLAVPGVVGGQDASTDDSGLARFYIEDRSGEFFIMVISPDSSRWASTNLETVRLPAGEDGVSRVQVTLLASNVKLRLVDPESPDTPFGYGVLEISDATTDAWLREWSANDVGNINIRLADGSYVFKVRPEPSQPGAGAFGARSYEASVTGGLLTVTGAEQDGDRWVLSPSPATFSGQVVEPDGTGARYAWVEVARPVTQDGVDGLEPVGGVVSGRDGTFGVTVDDGEYRLRANPPWGRTSLAVSSWCTLVVTGGADDTVASTCDDSALRLREPNLAFTIVDAGDTPQSYASACLTDTTPWTCVTARRNGRVSFFIDDTATLPGGVATLELQPPWGASNVARTEFDVNAAEIGVAWGPDDGQRVAMDSPNVRVTVSLEGGGLARDGFVSVQDDPTGLWLAGAQIGRSGVAALNLDDTSSTVCLTVWPGWQGRNTHGEYRQCGVSVASGSLAVEVPTANVDTTVVDANGRPNSFGWVEVVAVGGSTWGVSLDDRGRLTTSLDDGDYVLTFYPGWQRSGVPTEVEVTVAAGGAADIAEQVTLANGNVTGSVLVAGDPVAGAIVTVTVGARLVSAATDADGRFVLSLPVGGPYPVSLLLPPGAGGVAVLSGLSASASLSGGQLTVTAS